MTQSPRKPTLSAQINCPFDGDPCRYPCDKLVIAKCSAGMSDKDVIRELDVARTTWFRYRNGQQKPSRSVCFFLHAMTGYLPWTGWEKCFVNQREQKLYIDENKYGLTLHDLQSYWWQLQELRVHRRQRRKQLEQASQPILELVPLSGAS